MAIPLPIGTLQWVTHGLRKFFIGHETRSIMMSAFWAGEAPTSSGVVYKSSLVPLRSPPTFYGFVSESLTIAIASGSDNDNDSYPRPTPLFSLDSFSSRSDVDRRSFVVQRRGPDDSKAAEALAMMR
ncbi:hypothetical protein BHM03_00021673 [Ensete ventricosum]|nr:hypothetical protein BHM03_00021673 [Ensete ventricosum]